VVARTRGLLVLVVVLVFSQRVLRGWLQSWRDLGLHRGGESSDIKGFLSLPSTFLPSFFRITVTAASLPSTQNTQYNDSILVHVHRKLFHQHHSANLFAILHDHTRFVFFRLPICNYIRYSLSLCILNERMGYHLLLLDITTFMLLIVNLEENERTKRNETNVYPPLASSPPHPAPYMHTHARTYLA